MDLKYCGFDNIGFRNVSNNWIDLQKSFSVTGNLTILTTQYSKLNLI